MLNSSSRNVLFIVVDDLRPNLGAYGHSFMHTPRMDELADSGTLFQRAYAQYAFCAPSRNSFMTGRRPDVTRAYSFMNHFRESDVGRNWLSFPQYFRAAGYWAAGAGKLYHPGLPPNFDAADASGRKLSWDTFVWGGECNGNTNGWPLLQPHVTNAVCLPAVDSCGKKEGRDGESESEQIVYGADGAAELWCVQDESKLKAPLVDHVTVDATVAHLRTAAARPAVPFFVAAGLKKPHLPFYYPTELDALYPPASQIAPPRRRYPPQGMPLAAWHEGHFNNTFVTPTPPSQASVFRRAYYSAVSFTDRNVGVLLDELSALRLADRTLVALVGDHGWQLGEMDLCRKMLRAWRAPSW